MAKILLSIAELLRAHTGFTKKFPIQAKIPSPDPEKIKMVTPVTGEVVLEKSENEEVLGRFNLVTKIELTCARCLKRFPKKIHCQYEQKFKSKTSVIEKDADILATISENQLDILPSIQQEILLALPLLILCQKDCQGLCPKCGQNLNLKKCSCPRKVENKPLGKLRKIINESTKVHN